MRFGAVFPTTDIGRDVGAIRAFAQGVEALGFDHLVAYDHVLGARHEGRARPLTGPYDEHDEFHEPFVLFSHLAAVTTQLEFAVGVLVAPQRQTALVAKQAAEVQLLSEGRLRVGLGTGWNWVEYESLGADFEHRGAVLDEQIEVLRRLWTEPLVDVDGRFHRIDHAGLAPLPDRPIPLWIGGYSPAALRRSVRYGDGHLFGHLRSATIEAAAKISTMLGDAGRSPDSFGLEAITDIAIDPDRWVDTVGGWSAAGGTHISIRTMTTAGAPDPGLRSVDDHLDAIEQWRDVLRGEGHWTVP